MIDLSMEIFKRVQRMFTNSPRSGRPRVGALCPRLRSRWQLCRLTDAACPLRVRMGLPCDICSAHGAGVLRPRRTGRLLSGSPLSFSRVRKKKGGKEKERQRGRTSPLDTPYALVLSSFGHKGPVLVSDALRSCGILLSDPALRSGRLSCLLSRKTSVGSAGRTCVCCQARAGASAFERQPGTHWGESRGGSTVPLWRSFFFPLFLFLTHRKRNRVPAG